MVLVHVAQLTLAWIDYGTWLCYVCIDWLWYLMLLLPIVSSWWRQVAEYR